MTTVDKPVTAMTVTGAEELPTSVHQRAAMVRLGSPIIGDLQVQLQAFAEISAALAQLKLNGWDTVPKCKSACWLARGLGVDPVVLMNSAWVMEAKGGRLMIEYQWPFVIDLLTTRLPGFQWKVLHEGADYCEVWMKAGANEHTYKYEMADAKRQGLIDGEKFNAWKGGNTREMMKAKAVKRCADMMGGGAASGLPPMLEEDVAPAALPTASEVFAEAPKAMLKAVAAERVSSTFDPEIAEAPKRLSIVLNVLFAKPNKAEKLRLCGVIYSEMTGTQTAFASWDQVTPGDCKLMLDFLKKKYPNMKPGSEAADEGGTRDVVQPESAAEPPAKAEAGGTAVDPVVSGTDVAPPAEDVVPLEAEADPLVEAGREAAEDEDGKFTTVLYLVNQARKTQKGRTFIREVPEGSGRFYYTDPIIGKRLGFKSAPKLYTKDASGPTQALDAATVRLICREMRNDGIE